MKVTIDYRQVRYWEQQHERSTDRFSSARARFYRAVQAGAARGSQKAESLQARPPYVRK
jgi:hypothetical protein